MDVIQLSAIILKYNLIYGILLKPTYFNVQFAPWLDMTLLLLVFLFIYSLFYWLEKTTPTLHVPWVFYWTCIWYNVLRYFKEKKFIAIVLTFGLREQFPDLKNYPRIKAFYRVITIIFIVIEI